MSKGKSGSSTNAEFDEASMTKRRKIEHIEICLKQDVQCRQSTLLEDIDFVHNALPEIDKDKIDLSLNFLGLRAEAPLVIAAMTGGHRETYEINKRLAEAAEDMRIPIGVGSQRAAVEDPSLVDTFRVVRDNAPSVPVIGNIGATHVNEAPKAVEMIDADLLAIHLNPLQEAVQPEGDCNSEGFIESIAAIIDLVDVPVIVKETGAGISRSVAEALESIGVDGLDVGGVGGTSWAAVEYYRAISEEDTAKAQLGLEFWDWGIPTALSVIMAREVTDLPIIATGGIRSGLDIAKALAFGAISAGVAHPLLEPAANGTTDDIKVELQGMLETLRTAMYLTGCLNVDELVDTQLVIRGDLKNRLKALDIDYRKLSSGR